MIKVFLLTLEIDQIEEDADIEGLKANIKELVEQVYPFNDVVIEEVE